MDPNLKGNGVSVAQPESTTGNNDFEVNPAAVGQPTSLFTWTSSSGSATTYPNAVGIESGHADAVGNNFYGISAGVAPSIAHVDNYDADYFYNSIVNVLTPQTIAARVVNQSFLFGNEQASVDQSYDNYADDFKTLFVSAVGNGGAVQSPGTAYNSIGVGVSGAISSFGPTANGRCKPDIVAPGGATSFSAPYVSGAAALLLQAGTRGDGGGNVTAATDLRTVKALLLNGAVKPADWTNSITHPVDLRYGAGIVNAFNSWNQLKGGKHGFVEATTVSSGSAHPPGSNTNNVAAVGWDFNSITNSRVGHTLDDRIHHYYFNVPATNGAAFTFTATLAWDRPSGQSSITDLNLYLYNATTGTLVASSVSSVDNVEHIFQTKLPVGRYDLQVLKPGGSASLINDTETYALAYEAFSVRMTETRSNDIVTIAWPVSPDGFILQATTNLTTPAWTALPTSPLITNGMNVVSVATTNAQRFFRLQRP